MCAVDWKIIRGSGVLILAILLVWRTDDWLICNSVGLCSRLPSPGLVPALLYPVYEENYSRYLNMFFHYKWLLTSFHKVDREIKQISKNAVVASALSKYRFCWFNLCVKLWMIKYDFGCPVDKFHCGVLLSLSLRSKSYWGFAALRMCVCPRWLIF